MGTPEHPAGALGDRLTFFNWMLRSRYILENPLAGAMRRPVVKKAAGLIYTPGEAKHILRLTKDTDEVGFWALSLFGGLREYELQRIQMRKNPWEVVDFKRGMIDLSDTPTACHRRLVSILPVLAAWLHWMKARDVPFHPPNHWEKFRTTRATVLAHRFPSAAKPRERRLSPQFQGKKVYSMARRSYVSYRLALTGSSFAHVAEGSGITERLLRSDFTRKVAREEAQEYFGLKPKCI